jgi:hypothetical protein
MLLIPGVSLAGSGGLSGKFNNAAGKSITGTPVGGLINGAEKITLWIVVSAISGTLGVNAESSPDGVNLTSGGALGKVSGITTPGTYQITYNATPISMIGLDWTLGTATDTCTIDGIFFEGSLA